MTTNFHEIASGKGWSKDEQIGVLLEYIGNQDSPEAFADFLGEQDGNESGLHSFTVLAVWPCGGSWESDVTGLTVEDAAAIAKDIMAEDSCVRFESDDERQAFKNAITIVNCQ